MIVVPTITDPTLADAVIAKIQEGLKSSLSWLDFAFGRAERIVKKTNGRNLYLPAIYSGDTSRPNEYLELSPDALIGNFSFFWMLDPQKFVPVSRVSGVYKDPFALIFWFDLRKVYNSSSNRNVFALEDQVMKALSGEILIPNGAIHVEKIYHLAENIYREFSLDEVDNQFLMHPYAGFRLEGELIYEEPCQTS